LEGWPPLQGWQPLQMPPTHEHSCACVNDYVRVRWLRNLGMCVPVYVCVCVYVCICVCICVYVCVYMYVYVYV